MYRWRRSANKELVFRVEHGPDSVWDTNALMVFHNEKWHIIGYQQYLHKLKKKQFPFVKKFLDLVDSEQKLKGFNISYVQM